MIRKTLTQLLTPVILVAIAVSPSVAVDVVLTHQGRLLDAGDQPVTGTVSLTFRVFEAPTGGVELWSETHPSVAVEQGLFIAQLGETVPLPVDALSPSSDSPVTRWLEIQVGGETLVPRQRLGTTPSAASSSRVSGDISTSPGAVRLGGMSGSTTGTIRMAAAPDSAGTILDHDADGDGVPESSVSSKTKGTKATGGYVGGMSGSTTGTIRMAAAPDSTETTLDSDSDGDGVPESSVSSKTKGTKATGGYVGGMSGSTTGTIRMAASPDSTESVLDQDSDGDGLPESSVSSKTKGTKATGGYVGGMSGSTTGTIRLAASPDSTETTLDSDSDGDGVPESSVSSKTKGTKATGGYVGGMSGSTTGTIRMAASPDSSTSALDSDTNGDGVPESTVKSKTSGPRAGSILSGMSGSTTGTIRMSAAPDSTMTVLGTDTDGDGLPNNSLVHKSKGTQAGSTYSGMSGSTTATIRMQATGGDIQGPALGSVSVELDDDADGDPDGGCSLEAQQTRAELKTRFENGDIPTQDNIVRTTCDADGAEVTVRRPTTALLTWGSGLAFRVDGAGPSIEMDSDSVPTFTVHDGEGYLSSKIGIGKTPIEKIDVDGGAYCDGSLWVNGSDVNSKENFRAVDGNDLLNKIAKLEITEWNYKGDDGTSHIGPMAQDFKKSFGVGKDDKSISTIDPSGIALAAIKELHKQFSEAMKQKDAQIDDLQKQLETLQHQLKQQ